MHTGGFRDDGHPVCQVLSGDAEGGEQQRMLIPKAEDGGGSGSMERRGGW